MTVSHGRMLGRYRLDEPLGQGGMAEVWRATDTKLTRPVAVKVIHASIAKDPQFAERFLREARVVASLEHPHILPVYDFGEEDGLPFLVMPLLSGGTLRDRLRTAPPQPALAAAWIRELADALDAAHAAGVLHRDVKPANVLLGKGDRLFLADFGIAKMVETLTGLTATGVVVGTPTYMAPEQAQGKPASAATDRYALAAVAFEILAGRPPFDGESPLSLMHQHVTSPPPALSSKASGLPAGLDAVFAQALAKDPADRPPSCRALADAVAALLPTGPTAAVASAGAASPSTPAPFSAPFPSGTAPTVLQPRDGTAPTVLQPRERTPRPSPSLTSEATILTSGRKKRRALLWAATAVAAGVAVLGFLLKVKKAPEPVPAAAPSPAPAAAAPTAIPAAAASSTTTAGASTSAAPPITLVEIPSSASSDAARARDAEEKRIAELEKRVQKAETEAREARAAAAAPRPADSRPAEPIPPTPPPATSAEETPVEAGPAHAAMVSIRERLDVRTKAAHRLVKEDFEWVLATAQGVLREHPKNPEARFYTMFAQGGLAYVSRNDAIASAVAAEAVSVLKRTNRQEHRALALLLTRPDGTVAPPHGWELAVAYGDARGEAMGLLDEAIRENPRDQRAQRARGMLRKLQGLPQDGPAARRR